MIRKGTLVRLKKGTVHGPRQSDVKNFKTARVRNRYSDIPGGVRLERPMGGFVSWNVKDLERVNT